MSLASGSLQICPSCMPSKTPQFLAMQMREKDLSADDAAQYAQQIMTGRIRLSELSAVGSTANQEHMVRLRMCL